jgi:hypothetical protein
MWRRSDQRREIIERCTAYAARLAVGSSYALCGEQRRHERHHIFTVTELIPENGSRIMGDDTPER